jgi:hypothetical protein
MLIGFNKRRTDRKFLRNPNLNEISLGADTPTIKSGRVKPALFGLLS